jgi:hypothetical protein
MDALFAQMNSEPDLAKRKRVWDKVEMLNWEDGAFVRLGNLLSQRAYSEALQGFSAGDNIILWNVWIRR